VARSVIGFPEQNGTSKNRSIQFRSDFKTGALNHSATHPTKNVKHSAFSKSAQNPKLAGDWADHHNASLRFLYQHFV
jgi:hypothetical protein